MPSLPHGNSHPVLQISETKWVLLCSGWAQFLFKLISVIIIFISALYYSKTQSKNTLEFFSQSDAKQVLNLTGNYFWGTKVNKEQESLITCYTSPSAFFCNIVHASKTLLWLNNFLFPLWLNSCRMGYFAQTSSHVWTKTQPQVWKVIWKKSAITQQYFKGGEFSILEEKLSSDLTIPDYILHQHSSTGT